MCSLPQHGWGKITKTTPTAVGATYRRIGAQQPRVFEAQRLHNIYCIWGSGFCANKAPAKQLKSVGHGEQIAQQRGRQRRTVEAQRPRVAKRAQLRSHFRQQRGGRNDRSMDGRVENTH